MLGAIVSIVQKIFILVVGSMGLVDLMTFKDPNITQYTIYDARLDGKEVGFKEANGNLFFAIYDIKENKYVELD